MPSSIKNKNLHETGQIVSYESIFYAWKHGTIRNAIVDKDKQSLTKIKNLHETGQIESYRPEN